MTFREKPEENLFRQVSMLFGEACHFFEITVAITTNGQMEMLNYSVK
jgi:hypothetical protein